MLAEANVDPADIHEFISDRRMQMGFGFLFNQYLFLALARRTAEPLRRVLDLVPRLGELGQWAQFLRNHDELDLARLSPQERKDIFEALAPDPATHIYGRGVRRRLAPLLHGERRRLELAFSLMFSLPGSPVLYYGDEIGMGDDLSEPERWSVRTCMQWADARNGGFSSAPSEELIHPVIGGGAFGFETVNVTGQERDPDSLLHWMRRMCQLRMSCREVGWGDMSIIETDAEAVLAHRFRWRGRTLVLLHNLDDSRCEVEPQFDPDERARGLYDLFGNQLYEANGEGPLRFTLDGYGYRWLRMQERAS